MSAPSAVAHGNASGSDASSSAQPAAKKPYQQILYEEIVEGLQAFERPTRCLFLSALSAGLDIGFSVFLMAVLRTQLEGQLSSAYLGLVTANMYAFGFIVVALGRSELFTEHTTLAVLPVLNGRASVLALARVWGIIYVGNLIGTLAFAALIAFIGPRTEMIAPEAFGTLARPFVQHSGVEILLSAVLAGWLMGLLSWLVTAARDTISQIVIVWLIAFAIGVAHLCHPIVGSVEVLSGLFARQGITWADYGHYMLWATLGTALGGTIFVALIKYSHANPGELAEMERNHTDDNGR